MRAEDFAEGLQIGSSMGFVGEEVTAFGPFVPGVQSDHAGAGFGGQRGGSNPRHLPARGAVIYALPMKIGGGSGAPVRVLAVLPER